SWTWVFWLNPAIALVALLCIVPFYPLLPNQHRTPKPFDWPGFALFAFAMAALTYVLIEGARWNWFEAGHIRLWAWLGAGSLVTYGERVLTRRRQSELLDWSVFEN